MSVIFDALTGQIINLSSVSGGVTPPASTTPEIRPHFFSTVNNSTLDDNSDVVWFDTSLGNFSVFLPLNPQQNQILKLVGIANGPGLVTLNANTNQVIDGVLPLVGFQKGIVIQFSKSSWYMLSNINLPNHKLTNQYSQNNGQVFAVGGNTAKVVYNHIDYESEAGLYNTTTGIFTVTTPRNFLISAKLRVSATNTLASAVYRLLIRYDVTIINEISATGPIVSGDDVIFHSVSVILNAIPGKNYQISLYSGQGHNVINLVAAADSAINYLTFIEV